MNPLAMLALASTGLQVLGTFQQAEQAKAQSELSEAQLEIQRQADEYERELKAQDMRRKQRKALAKQALRGAATNTTTSSSFINQITSITNEYNRGLYELERGADITEDQYDIRQTEIDINKPSEMDTFLTVLGQSAQGGMQAYSINQNLGSTSSDTTSTSGRSRNWNPATSRIGTQGTTFPSGGING